LGFAYYYNGQFTAAEELYQEALTAFAYLGNQRGSAYTRYLLALVNERVGHYRAAEENLRLLISTREDMGRGEPLWLGALGRVYIRQGRYAEAQPILEEAYALSPRRFQPNVLIILGAAVRWMGNAAEAQELLLRGLAIAEEMGGRPAQTDLLAELGFTAIQHGEAAVAQNHFSRSLAVAQEIRRLRNVPVALMGLGRVALMQGRMQPARDYFAQALTASAEVQAPPDLLDVLVSVGELYAAEGKPVAALELLELAARHPATTHETRSRAQRLLQTLGAEDAASESKLAAEEARTRLEEVTRKTTADLQGLPATNPDSGAAAKQTNTAAP